MLIYTGLLNENKMKRLVSAVILSLGLSACSTAHSVEQADASPCTETSCRAPKLAASNDSIMDTIGKENCQFSLPGSGWKAAKYPNDTIKVMMVNESLDTILFLAKEETKESFADYIINTLRTFHAAGATVVSAKQVILNGAPFILVNAIENDRRILSWITVQKGFGYVFTCAVQSEEDGSNTDFDRCVAVANTLSIK
jgi:hypothetical protein